MKTERTEGSEIPPSTAPCQSTAADKGETPEVLAGAGLQIQVSTGSREVPPPPTPGLISRNTHRPTTVENKAEYESAEGRVHDAEYKVRRVCNVQVMRSRNVNQEGRKYLPSSPIAAKYVPSSAGGRAHVAIKGSQAGATPVIPSDL